MNTDNLTTHQRTVHDKLDPYRIKRLEVIAFATGLTNEETQDALDTLIQRGLVTKTMVVGIAYYRYSRDYAYEVTR